MQMVEHIRRIETVDVGYETAGRLSVRVALSDRRLPTAEARVAFVAQLLDAFRRVPGVESVGVTSLLPIGGGNQIAPVSIDSQSAEEPSRLSVNHRIVDGTFFKTVGMPIVAGRTFDDSDRTDSEPVVIVSRALAEKLWPGESALGKRIKRGRPADRAPWLNVIGVVGNVREPREAAAESWYLPYAQHVTGFTGSVQPNFILRASGDPGLIAEPARSAVRALDSSVPVFQVATLDALQAVFYSQEHLGTTVMSLFAIGGLLLVLLGVHGVTTYSISQRMHEIGVRMAFGADGAQIVRMMLRQTVSVTAVGLVIGSIGAIAVSRALDRFVPGIQPASGSVFVLTAAGLSVVAFAAAVWPAWRAVRRDPLAALRASG
jgi:putative ABC transport system permease protein